ncbi:hypothetical protein PHYPSEUDO_007227 [Phytophthora pseudosyringae]|uniref:Uncharacterized protein n=1 Tax=Phytophthora pseudosyringae TaxID=221518 RepID=A0A8T1VHH6_9STRA|nr:hypothetical protein PHYPSEUDO_007227 [Phytophthora pseudosyringae]
MHFAAFVAVRGVAVRGAVRHAAVFGAAVGHAALSLVPPFAMQPIVMPLLAVPPPPHPPRCQWRQRREHLDSVEARGVLDELLGELRLQVEELAALRSRPTPSRPPDRRPRSPAP